MKSEYKFKISELIDQGYSVIPVDVNKRALIDWKQNQQSALQYKDIILHIENGVQNFAVVCGYNNLECIDIDTKNLDEGVPPIKFCDEFVEKIPLEIWSKLVVQDTPSGGKHLLYKCSEVGKNQHLAKSKAGKPIIETRGEGGYVLIEPSEGYNVNEGELTAIQDLSPKEREQLFAICRSFHNKRTGQNRYPGSASADIIELTKLCIEQIETKELDITSNYEDWVRIGFAFANEFGEEGREHFHRVSRFHPKYDPEECDRKFDSFLDSEPGPSSERPITIASFCDLCQKNGIKLLGKREGKVAQKYERVLKYLQTKEPKFNEFTRKTEIAGEELNDRHVNSMYADLQEIGIPASKDYINTILLSDRTPEHHPIRDFIIEALKKDFAGEIDKLQASLTFVSSDPADIKLQQHLFVKWLLQIPAVVFDETPPRLVLVLIGESHIGKTHFLRHLLPNELKAYYAESGLNRDKDSMILMSEKLLINNDEFGGIMRMKEMEQFKRFASAESFDERRAYGRYNEKFRRRAVLCGTSNRFEVIIDQTASNTRIIPIELKSYDHKLFNSIDKGRLLAELTWLYNRLGKDCVKLKADELRDLEQYSKNYETVNMEQLAILNVCVPGTHFFTTYDIAGLIKERSNVQINLKKLAQTLKMLEFKGVRKRINDQNLRGWLIDLKGYGSSSSA